MIGLKQDTRTWFVSELYYPEETSTGYIVTQIAESLARSMPVHVLAAQPTYSQRGLKSPRRERHHGVSIRRVWSTRLNKDVIALRLVNFLTIGTSIFINALLRLRKGDQVVMVTNPPVLPFVVALACRLRRARAVLLIHDVYPDVLAVAGFLDRRSIAYRTLDRLTRNLYRSAAGILVLGRDQRDLVLSKMRGAHPDRVAVIPNWADTDLVDARPKTQSSYLADLGLADRFVVQLAGNIGPLQGVDNTLEAIALLKDEPHIHFLFVGHGGRRKWLVNEAARLGLENVTVAEPVTRANSADMHGGCDLVLISLAAGMLGVSVPSRFQNALAAGRPIVAVVDPRSEVAHVVEEKEVGWVAAPGDAQELATTILTASRDPARLAELGRNARRAAETEYARPMVLARYADYFRSTAGST